MAPPLRMPAPLLAAAAALLPALLVAGAPFEPRPIYHLTYDARSSGYFSDPPAFTANATRSFMNDPNGLLIFGGRYHVFGQWGENGHAGAAWLHAVSDNLADWQLLPPAIVEPEQLHGEQQQVTPGHRFQVRPRQRQRRRWRRQ